MSEQTGHAAHADAAHANTSITSLRPGFTSLFSLSLLVLTGLTVGASYIEMGIFNPIVALAIGVVKATLVVLFFMGVKYSTKLTKLTLFAGLFTFMALIGMTLADYITRAWGRW